MHRYPEATETTSDVAIAALKAHAEALDGFAECSGLWQALSGAARTAAEASEPDWPFVKALWLLADACSLMLDGDSANEPFGPLAVFSDGRSAITGDFKAEDFQLFSSVSASVVNRALRARLADLAWIGARPKNVDDARRAIDAYVAEEPTEGSWVSILKEWRRAVTLCLQLRKASEGRLEKVEQTLERIAETALKLDGGLGRAVARLLFDRNLADGSAAKFAELLAMRGESMAVPGSDLWNARAYLDLAGQWFGRLADHERAADMTVKIASSFEAEADYGIALEPQMGHLVAQSFLEDAIQTLRKVPKDQRPTRKVDEELLRLSLRRRESGEKAVMAIPTIRTGRTDITEIVEQSVRAVRGKKPLQALLALAQLHTGANLARLTQFAEESLQEFVFSRLFGASHISRDGRVIAKTPGGTLNENSEQHKAKILSKVLEHHGLEINLVSQGQIIPALATLIQEHTIGKADLAQLMSLAPIVPPGRADQFAKGLWEGFEGDFSTAIYLLAPQMENLVRWHLKQAGTKTSNIDREGIENEVGLSTLVEMPELRTLFDEDIVFEMQALFCSALGPNLRNQVAHGLLDSDEARSVGSVYAWWWVLRLTLGSFVHSRMDLAKVEAPSAAAEAPSQVGDS